MTQDAYWTLDGETGAEMRVKGSRFIGYASSVDSPEEADEHLRVIRKKYHGATHHCFAYRIGTDGEIFRRSDDGEPSGTAGKPILEALAGRNLTDALCIVTRYFGGVKLGTGGLARAYGACAAQTLDAAKVVLKHIHVSFRMIFPYDATGTVMSLLSGAGSRIIETHYGEDTEILIRVPRALAEDLSFRLREATGGKVTLYPVTGGGH